MAERSEAEKSDESDESDEEKEKVTRAKPPSEARRKESPGGALLAAKGRPLISGG